MIGAQSVRDDQNNVSRLKVGRLSVGQARLTVFERRREATIVKAHQPGSRIEFEKTTDRLSI